MDLYFLSFSAGFFVTDIVIRKYSPRINLKLFKKKLRIHHSYLCVPGSALLFLDHFTLASGFLGSSLHDIYWHIRYRKKKLEEKINLTKTKISKKLSPVK